MSNELFGDVFDFEIAGTEVCGDSHNINLTRQVVNVRTNCGNNVVAGANEYTVDLSGPLAFAAGATEVTLWTTMTTTTAQTWETETDGGGVAATAPKYSGSLLADTFNISMGVGAPITFSWSAQGTDTAGVPTRATA